MIKKPEPNPPDDGTAVTQVAEQRAFQDAAGVIGSDIERAIKCASWWNRHKAGFYTFLITLVVGFAASLAANYVFEFMPTRGFCRVTR